MVNGWKEESVDNGSLFKKKLMSVLLRYNPRGVSETPWHFFLSRKGIIVEHKMFSSESEQTDFANEYMEGH